MSGDKTNKSHEVNIKDFISDLQNGFQIIVMQNSVVPEGKGYLLLSAKDYRTYTDALKVKS